jgi:hypothetical protein
MAIITIQLEVADSRLIAMLAQANVVRVLKKVPVKAKQVKRAKQPKVRDGEAPWGRKKDGTPKKRPGRPAGGEQ